MGNYKFYRGIIGVANKSIAFGVESALIALNTYGKNFEMIVLADRHSSADVMQSTRIDNKGFSTKDRLQIAEGIAWLIGHYGTDWKDKFLHKENRKSRSTNK